MSQKFVTRGKLLAQLESGLNLVRSDLSEVIMVGVVKSQRDLGRFWGDDRLVLCHALGRCGSEVSSSNL